MLEDLDNIDWGILGASQLPVWLRDLASHNLMTRKKAYTNLSENLVPWEVFDGLYSEELPRLVKRKETYLSIPFLIGLLEDAAVGSKENLLSLLYYISLYIKLDKYLPEDQREQYQYYARQLYDAVYKGLQIYQALVHSDIPEISQSAKTLVEVLIP